MRLRLKKLPRSFYLRPTLKVARELLGLFLVRKIGTQKLIGRIVEVEAYLGFRDPASHAFRGRTARNEVMFWKGGHLYVYFTYGMHFCANVVTEKEEIGHAVLLRAVEPIDGIPVMKRNRKQPANDSLYALCNGPARLCQAFGIGRERNGTDLCGNEIWIGSRIGVTSNLIVKRSTRIGITKGRRRRWRFYLKENPFVSHGKPVA